MKTKKLKLFVWENVLVDYTEGVMFALAPDVESARLAILEKEGKYVKGKTFAKHIKIKVYCSVTSDLQTEPRVIETTEGFAVWGGG